MIMKEGLEQKALDLQFISGAKSSTINRSNNSNFTRAYGNDLAHLRGKSFVSPLSQRS